MCPINSPRARSSPPRARPSMQREPPPPIRRHLTSVGKQGSFTDILRERARRGKERSARWTSYGRFQVPVTDELDSLCFDLPLDSQVGPGVGHALAVECDIFSVRRCRLSTERL